MHLKLIKIMPCLTYLALRLSAAHEGGLVLLIKMTQNAHDVVLTSVRRRFNVMNVVWMSKRCRVLTGQIYSMVATFSVEWQDL